MRASEKPKIKKLSYRSTQRSHYSQGPCGYFYYHTNNYKFGSALIYHFHTPLRYQVRNNEVVVGDWTLFRI